MIAARPHVLAGQRADRDVGHAAGLRQPVPGALAFEVQVHPDETFARGAVAEIDPVETPRAAAAIQLQGANQSVPVVHAPARLR